MNYLHRAYLRKYHGHSRECEASFIDGDAPVLDAYVGLLEAPEYVLYLGLRDNAEAELKKAGCWMSMSQKQFSHEGMQAKYYKRRGVIDNGN